MDKLGRIVLPMELRKTLRIDLNTPLEMFVDGEYILLKKYQPAGACDYCGEITEGMAEFCGHHICPACRAKIAAL